MVSIKTAWRLHVNISFLQPFQARSVIYTWARFAKLTKLQKEIKDCFERHKTRVISSSQGGEYEESSHLQTRSTITDELPT
jgi:hypothetical protein